MRVRYSSSGSEVKSFTLPSPLKVGAIGLADGQLALVQEVTECFGLDGKVVMTPITRLEALKHRGFNLVEIKGGQFWMGAQKTNPCEVGYDPQAFDDESPVHRVNVETFLMADTPTTVAQFELFVMSGGYQNPEFWVNGGFGKTTSPGNWEKQLKHPNRPVVEVSWYEAAAFATWAGLELPSEEQWEFAARGKFSRKYPWGNAEPTAEHANFFPSGPGHVTDVKSYPLGRTPEGLWDMAGNVWEWTSDKYRSYAEKLAARG